MDEQRTPEEIARQFAENSPTGPARYSEHAVGERVRFHPDGNPDRVAEGVIVFVQAAGQIAAQTSPLCYFIDTGEGFPAVAWQTDLIESAL